jgi:predicted metal-dependent hydrolase
MNTEPHTITVSGIQVQVIRKAIKNLHLGVYPPHGRVRVAAPLAVSDNSVRLAVIGKLGWIKRKQSGFKGQPRQSQREMVTGESHYVWGRRYRLDVTECAARQSVRLRNNRTLELNVRHGTNRPAREAVLYGWYRQLLRVEIPKLIAKWEPLIQANVAHWGIKKMKTRWGTCNKAAGRIWINLELAKKPPSCLEYIFVHEMIHLLERHHNDRFREYMDRFMPSWQRYQEELNRAPLGHETWSY